MAQNTASSINPKNSRYTSRGKSRAVPYFCVGCKGKKEKKRRKQLFCGKCVNGYRQAKALEQEFDEAFERAIA